MHNNYDKEVENQEEMNISLVQEPQSDFVAQPLDTEEGAPDDSDDGGSSTSPPRSIAWDLGTGILSSAPTLALIGFGSGQSAGPLCIYTALILFTSIPAFYLRHKGGVLRWFVGFLVLLILSGFKSGLMLATCENFAIKAGLYAITALWECSNAVIILGGNALFNRFGIQDLNTTILYVCAPSQVLFVAEAGATSGAPNLRRTIHISLCGAGLALIYILLNAFESTRKMITSVVVLEVECLAFMASLMVVILDLPSHLWQCIHDIIPSPSAHSTTPRVVLPYGWVYSSTSTRQFWSRWSRPATQLIRHLLYYPLGGRDRWYLSIPIMFGLNATSHYDLSFSIVGDRAELFWNLIFGTLAIVAMVEVVGDSYFTNRDGRIQDHGEVELPKWYVWIRGILLHLSLRLVLFFMIHKCFKMSLNELFETKA